MLYRDEQSYERSLNEDFTLRTARDESDVERVAQFNGSIHGPGIVAMTRDIFLHHPDTTGRDLIFVEDREGRVLSSLCVIPWKLGYDGAALNSGEMGIVGTLPEYRRRGLIRSQVEFFKQRLRERGAHISHIQGIPYYYRQFGYEYAMPLEGGMRLTRRDLPAVAGRAYSFRLATPADLPVLMQMYDQAAGDLNIHTRRDEAVWRFLFAQSASSEMEAETWLIVDAQGLPAGYMRLPNHHFGDELTVNEVSRLDFDAAVAVLNHLACLSEERRTPGVRLCVPAGCTLMRVARSFGAHDMGTYAWQIHIPDVPALLRAIGPALERRLCASPFAGLTRDLALGFFRESVLLRFAGGKLAGVQRVGVDAEVQHAGRFPPQAFTPLVLGYRSLDELRTAYADLHVEPSCRLLVETLFPKVASFLYTIY